MRKPGIGRLTMGHIVIGTPKTHGSVLDNAPRDGFTKHAERFFNAVMPVDDVTEHEARVLQARMEFARAIGGIQSSRSATLN